MSETTAHPPLVWVPQYFGATVFDRRTSRYFPFDRATAALLREAIDTPWFDLVARQEDDARRDAMLALYAHFDRHGFFTIDHTLAAVALAVDDVPRDHLLGPLAVHLEVVAACNLTCAHCFAGELPRKAAALTLAELDGLFATLARLGSYRIGLTGGEPLLRKDLFDILDLATQHGLHPCITTNALLVDERIARELGRRELVWLNVSLDGATSESNDRVRGAGVFARVQEKLALLRRHTRFTLAFTVMQHNAAEAAACAKLAAEVGADTAVFRPLYPVGVAREHPELMPSYDDYVGALGALTALGDGGDLRNLEPFGPAQREGARAGVGNLGCGAGTTVCSISVSGDVNPCSFLGTDYDAGNVRVTSFERIWRESDGFRRMRGARFGDGGGCRARSLAYAGDVEAPDPWLAARERAPSLPHPLVVLRTKARASTF